MAVNLKVRMANKSFWLALIPAILVLAQVTAAPFGYVFKIDGISDQLVAIVNAAFCVLAILGIVNDPTTEGLSDSELAMGYNKPKPKHVSADDTAQLK